MTGFETHPFDSLWWLGQKFGKVQVQLYCYTRIVKKPVSTGKDPLVISSKQDVEDYARLIVESKAINDREELGLFDISWLGLPYHVRQLRREGKKEVAIHPEILVNGQKCWIPFIDGNGNWLKDLAANHKKAAQFLFSLKKTFPSKTIAIYKSGNSFHIYPEDVVMDMYEYPQFESDFSMDQSGYVDSKWFIVPSKDRGLRWSIGEEDRPEPTLIRRISL